MPKKLPSKPDFRWQTRLGSSGIGGICANRDFAIVGSRSITDRDDVFTCHQMADGHTLWQIRYRAEGQLDYGNSPRATPLIVGDRVVLLGAMGHLTVANLNTGDIVWKTQFTKQFKSSVPTWGFCGSPLLIRIQSGSVQKNVIVVQPGAKDASLVAFDLKDGSTLWASPGAAPSYGSMILADIGGRPQIIGYDQTTLGGWEPQTGRRLWTLSPKIDGDFNVPTPMLLGQRLFVSTENNGARLYQFNQAREIIDLPVAHFPDLTPDTHSPVVVGDMICGTSHELFCLRISDLNLVHKNEDEAFSDYTAAISDGKQRILFTTLTGSLLLVDCRSDRCDIISRLQVSDDEEILSHPAIVEDALIVRLGRTLACLPLPIEK